MFMMAVATGRDKRFGASFYYSIIISNLSSRPLVPLMENLAFLTWFADGSIEKLMAVRKSVFSRLVPSNTAPDRSQLSNTVPERFACVKSVSCNCVWIKIVFLIFIPVNTEWLSWQCSNEKARPKPLQRSKRRPSILQ